MQAQKTPARRFTECPLGTVAAVSAATLWIASMSLVDAKVYSVAPYLVGLLVIAALWLFALLRGDKMVKLRWLSWGSLAAGAYYLLRSHWSYSVVEAWGDAALVAGCIVFYIAGVYAGQGERSRMLVGTIMAALAINVVSYLYTRGGGPLPWSLRPEVGVCGPTAKNMAFFTFKNFAGFFLLTAGLLPLCRLVCSPGLRWRNVALAAAGLAASSVAFVVGTRAIWLLLPFLLAFIWLLRLVSCLGGGRRIDSVTIAGGVLLLLGGIVFLCEFMFGHTVVKAITGIDTHLRTMAWDLACRVAPGGGWFGYGARASQWEIVQGFNDWCTPNMVHNEYLQVWVDYGIVGLVLMVCIILFHFVAGFLQLASDAVGPGRRSKVCMAMLFLLGACLYAICDFGWHQMAIATGTAFACGVLASPYPMRRIRWRELWRNWAPGSHSSLVPVRAEPICGRIVIGLAAAALAVDMVRLIIPTGPAWMASWEYDRMVKTNALRSQRLALLEETHTYYPDARLLDYYVLQSMILARTDPSAADTRCTAFEPMLVRTLENNPRQVFTSIMLSRYRTLQGRHEEAELILRNAYKGDGPTSCRTNSWSYYYAFNLVDWGLHAMREGDLEKACSLLEYGLAVSKHGSFANTAWRTGIQPWRTKDYAKEQSRIFKAAKDTLDFLKPLVDQPDDSWQQPVEPGGKPSLYSRWKPSRK